MLWLLLTTSSLVELSEWLSTRAIGFDSRVALSGNQVVALKPADEGDTLLELNAGACLTARAAYADREMGRDLQSIATRVGPGFDTVALAAFLAAERVRNFEAETWYAGAGDARGRDVSQRASAWSPLTSAHLAAEALQPSAIDPDLVPLVQQGINLVIPIIELAARRAWVPGAAPSAPMFSDEWVRAAVSDDSAGWSRRDLEGVLTTSFARVLACQRSSPPPYFALGSGGSELSDEIPERWGYSDDAPEGAALLPPLEGLFVPVSELAEDESADANVAIGVPPKPAAGSLGEGVCVRCVATRPIESGETLLSQW